ncbi:MAG: DNA-3-methyladenine glycosylase I [Thermodesulfobacteriota bacterium]
MAGAEVVRCPWARGPEYEAYHDTEWGAPSRDDRHLFEKLVLEGAQAGLSWLTILKRREGYRRAFANFDAEKVARFTEADRARLLADPGIIRNKLKVASAIANAKAFLAVQEEFGSFAAYLWAFVDDTPIVNHFEKMSDVPAKTELSTALSRDLKRRGFSFVGPTAMYAYMQSVGLVNDHLVSCFRHAELASAPNR